MISVRKTCVVIAFAGLLVGADKPKRTDDLDGLPAAMRVEAVVIDLAKAPTQVLETKYKARISKIWGFKPSVMKVIPTSDPRRVTIVGIKPGVSLLYLMDEDGIEDKLTIVIPEKEIGEQKK